MNRSEEKINKREKLRKQIFRTIQIGSRDDLISRLFDYLIVFVIGVNLFVTLFSTFDSYKEFAGICDTIELITIIIFTIEYILRIWTADLLYDDIHGVKAILKFVFSFYGMVDFLTFFPYYLPIVFPAGAVAFRIFRVIRIFRLFKLNAQYDAFNVIIDVIDDKKNQLLSSICMISILMVAASLCMYSLEHEAQPECFQNAFSGIWWSASTLLTVGYGDIYPVTIAGKVMGILISFLGVGMVAIPTGIISAGFVEQYSKIKEFGGNLEEGEIRQIPIKGGHPWTGKKLSQLPIPEGETTILLRNGKLFYPTQTEQIRKGDMLVFLHEIKEEKPKKIVLKKEEKMNPEISNLPLEMKLRVTAVENNRLVAVISNQSGYEMSFETKWSIQKKINGAWTDLTQVRELKHQIETREISDLAQETLILDLSRYGLLSVGKYRLHLSDLETDFTLIEE